MNPGSPSIPAGSPRARRPLSVLLLGVVLVIFLLPLLAGWEPIFGGALASRYFPQQIFFARCLGRGVVPWWDPSVFAGASTVYSRPFQGLFYLPCRPVLVLARTLSWDGAYLWLVKVPLALHLFLAAGFAFAFARRLGLPGPGPALFSLAYALGPLILDGSRHPPSAFAGAWLPGILWCLLRYAGSGSTGWPLLGAIVFAVASPAGDAARAISSALALAVFSAAWAIVSARRAREASLRMIGGAAVILVLGFLLSGLYWSGVLWGAPPEKGAVFVPPSAPAGPPPRPAPLYLITLLFPSFFGIKGGGYAGAGALPGGIAVILTVLLGLRVVWRERKTAPAQNAVARAAMGAFGSVFCLGLFLILLGNGLGRGGFRPVSLFSGFSAGRDLSSFALAGLLGTSVGLLWNRGSAVRFRPLMSYLILVSVAAVVGWMGAGDPAAPSRPSVIGPILIYAAFSIVAILGGRAWLGPKRFLRGLVFLAAGEILFFGYLGFYRSGDPASDAADVWAVRSRFPSDHPAYRALTSAPAASPGEEGLFRRGFFRSSLDNLSWLAGSPGVLGFEPAPLSARFLRAASRASPGYPGEFRPKDWSLWFWRNMSVRDAILDAPSFFAGKRVQTPAGPWYFGHLPEALPRCYFQDRWVVTDEEQEFTALLTYDLRATAYCRREVWHVRPFADQYPAPEPLGAAEWIEHFADLQKKNRITAADFSDPNRLTFSVEVSQPCMLVVTDAWHPDWRARVDERGEAVHRVNYLQRGVWCRPGRYGIVMEFLPSILRIGIPLTAAGLLGAFLLALSAIRPLKPGRLRGAK